MSNSLAVPSQCNGCPKSEMATALFGDEDEVRLHNLLESLEIWLPKSNNDYDEVVIMLMMIMLLKVILSVLQR